jgi:hypothetical protein
MIYTFNHVLTYSDKREYNIGGKEWLDYFSNLGSIPIYMKEKVHKIEEKV